MDSVQNEGQAEKWAASLRVATARPRRTARHAARLALDYLKGDHRRYATTWSHTEDGPFCEPWSPYQTRIIQRPGPPTLHQGRVHNMKLAAHTLSGLVIQPGERLAFWRVIPPPVAKNGYLPGPSLHRGRLITDYGGGLCQVASTLFNTLLLANFEIIDHHHHSVDIHGPNRFFELGRDAAVAFGYKDLVARNNHRVPLRVHASVREGTLFSVWLRGPVAQPFEVRVKTSILGRHPKRTPCGQPGHRVQMRRNIRYPGDVWKENYRVIVQYAPY